MKQRKTVTLPLAFLTVTLMAACGGGGGGGAGNAAPPTTPPPGSSHGTYTIGGTVISASVELGLLELRSNQSEVLRLNTAGDFQFSGGYADGSHYEVSLSIAPAGQSCTLDPASASGDIAGANVMSIVVNCTPRSGSVDLDFGGLALGQSVDVSLGGESTPAGIALQADGRIVVAGSMFAGSSYGSGDYDFGLLRFEADGTLDATFGPSASGWLAPYRPGTDDRLQAVAIQPDGRILAAGYSAAAFAVLRYEADGTPDIAFGVYGDGLVTEDFGTSSAKANAVGIQPDGKILAAGFAHDSVNSNDLALARFLPGPIDGGVLDAGFDTDGRVTTDYNLTNGDEYVRGIAVYPPAGLATDNKIVAAGYTIYNDANGDRTYDFVVARYAPDGSLDTGPGGFSGNGKVRTNFGSDELAIGVAIQPMDRKIVVAGYSINFGYQTVLARYNTDGTLDPDFGVNGKSTPGVDGIASALALDGNGRILVAGNHGSECRVTRLFANGDLDPSFGSAGVASFTIPGGSCQVGAIAIQPADQKIIAAVYNYTYIPFAPDTGRAISLVRLHP